MIPVGTEPFASQNYNLSVINLEAVFRICKQLSQNTLNSFIINI